MRAVLKSTALVAGSRLTSSGLGFAKHVIAAFYFGTSGLMDAYLMAMVLPDLTMSLAQTGMFNFIPLHAAERAKSEKEGWAAASKMLTYWLLLMLVASFAAMAATPLLMRVVAPGFDASQSVLTVNLTRALFLMAVSVGFGRILAMVLESQKKFAASALSEVTFQIVSVGYLVLFHQHGISSMAWGMVIGGFAEMLVVCLGLWDDRKHLHLDFRLRHPLIKRVIKLILPIYVGTSGAKINVVVRRAFASLLPAGAISALQYAFMLVEAPVSIGASSLVRVLFPYFSEEFASDDETRGHRSLKRALVSVAVFFMPLSLGIFLLAFPLVQLLLERGEFDASSTALTATALRIYALAIIAMALNRVLTMAYHSRQDTATPMKAGLIRVGTNIVLCSLLIPELGFRGLALATTITEILKTGILFLWLTRLVPAAAVRSMLAALARLAMAVVAMSIVVYSLQMPAGFSQLTSLGVLPSLLGSACLGCVSYVAALWFFSRDEFEFHAAFLRKGFLQLAKRGRV